MWPPAISVFSAFFACAFVGRDDSARRSFPFRRVFRRPGGEFLFGRPKRNQKGARGCVQSAVRQSLPPPCRPSPRTPITRGYPLGWAKNFRRAKSEWLSAIFSGPLGPGIPKIEAGAAPPPRLTLPSQRSRFVSCVGATARVARKPSPLGEGAERSEADEGTGPGYKSGSFKP